MARYNKNSTVQRFIEIFRETKDTAATVQSFREDIANGKDYRSAELYRYADGVDEHPATAGTDNGIAMSGALRAVAVEIERPAIERAHRKTLVRIAHDEDTPHGIATLARDTLAAKFPERATEFELAALALDTDADDYDERLDELHADIFGN